MTKVPHEIEETRRLSEAVEAFGAIEDDTTCAVAVSEAMAALPKYQSRLREIRRKRVQAMKGSGKTWAQIGQLLSGISAARAQQISAGHRGERHRPKKKTGETSAE
jgi:hypothetical protein